MKLFFFVLLALGVACGASAQKSALSPNIRKFKNDTIVWKTDSLLKKEDFKARGRGKNGPLGFSNVGIFIYPGESGGQLIFYVEALFVKSKSYITQYSEYVLKHEQLHFDITELYARILRKKISETDFKRVRDAAKEISRLYQKTAADWQKEEDKYDKDTQHGVNSAKQQVWADDIQKRIKELAQYSASGIDIAH